jgi:hypothetical protein
VDAKRIALIVQEPKPGHFYWVLQQQDQQAGSAQPVETAPVPMPTYGLAMMAGISAMQRRADGHAARCGTITLDDFNDPRTDFGPTTIQ